MNKPIMGSIYIESDLNAIIARSQAPRTFVFSLTDEKEYVRYLPNAMGATVLLPPYEAMIYMSDNDKVAFRDVYLSYLATSKESSDLLLVMIMACLVRDNNILLYIPNDELEIGFLPILAEYITNVYGLFVGTPINQFGYNTAFDSQNLSMMYLEDLMGVEEYLELYPAGVGFYDNVIGKLMYDLVLNLRPEEDPKLWLFNYKERIKQNNNRFLQRGLIRL